MGVAVSRCTAPELPLKGGRRLVGWLNSGRRSPARRSSGDETRGAVGGAAAAADDDEGGEDDAAGFGAETMTSVAYEPLAGGWSRAFDLANVRFLETEDGRTQAYVPEVLHGPGHVRRVRHVLCGEKLLPVHAVQQAVSSSLFFSST